MLRTTSGFKAVRMPAGTSEVVFYFDDGLRGWLRSGVYFTAVIMGLLLFGSMLITAAGVPRQGDRETRRQGERCLLVSLSPCLLVCLSG